MPIPPRGNRDRRRPLHRRGRVSELEPAWSLLQAAELLRACDRLVLPALATLHGIDADRLVQEDRTLSADDVSALRRTGEQLYDLVERLHLLLERLPDEAVEITHADVARAARDDLAEGVVDAARLLLAAHVLHVGQGWRALARSLRTADVHGAWECLTAGELLERFHGADAALVARALAAAELPAETPLARCDGAQLARLAAALEEHAPA